MNLGDDQFLGAVADFERSLAADEAAEVERAHGELRRHIADAGVAELTDAGPRLAAALASVPLGGRGDIAAMVGYCVEVGADPLRCAPPVLENLVEALEGAYEFAEQWKSAMEVELPDPKDVAAEEEMVGALFEAFGAWPTLSWLTLSGWVTASLSMLQRKAVRQGIDDSLRESITLHHNAYCESSGTEGKDITWALQVLDDEPFIALDRETGTGYRLRMSGIADNFQLQTLLGNALIGDHLPGEPPSADAVAVSRDSDGRVPTVASFRVSAPDGSRIWNEGTPSDIPVIDGTRLLVLDPMPYPHHFPALRYFPSMVAELELEGTLSPAECAGWFEHVKPAEDTF